MMIRMMMMLEEGSDSCHLLFGQGYVMRKFRQQNERDREREHRELTRQAESKDNTQLASRASRPFHKANNWTTRDAYSVRYRYKYSYSYTCRFSYSWQHTHKQRQTHRQLHVWTANALDNVAPTHCPCTVLQSRRYSCSHCPAQTTIAVTVTVHIDVHIDAYILYKVSSVASRNNKSQSPPKAANIIGSLLSLPFLYLPSPLTLSLLFSAFFCSGSG